DTEATIAPTSAKLVWTEVADLVSNIAFADGKISFTASGATGNAVIAATDAEGTILWSWHIWSGYTLEEVVVNDENMAGYVYGFLSRNIGASSDTDGGLYYQWGRKDPFSAILAFDSASGAGKYHPVKSGDENNTIAYANAHPIEYLAKSSRNNDWLLEYPQRYLWGQNWEVDQNPNFSPFGKTIYDPCPVGYSVATPTSMSNTTVTKNSDGKGGFTMYGGKIFVPAAGFIYNGGYGWYGQTSSANLWTNSTSWGNVENAFRRTDSDGRNGYDRACGIPVRCFRNAK
ncbi:MAG: hypothetical protein MJY56_05665, partial [Bacteroidales bacterium]|nr:hypothetical protein [Bacteroidales bacterium]